MKIKQIIYLAGVATLLAACSSDDSVQQVRVPVTLSYTTAGPAASTRSAAATDINDDHIMNGKQVTVRISNTGLGEWKDYVYTAGESGVLNLPATNVPYYPLDGTTKIDILAYYPTFEGTAFTIQTDQSTDDGYAASDLMWADPSPLTNLAMTTSSQTLQFTHKMAKIIVKAAAGSGITQINSVTLKQVKPTVTFAKGTGDVSNLRGTAGDVLMATGETGTSVDCAAVIPSQTITGNLLEIGVTLSDATTTGTATFSIDSKTFNASAVYTLDLTVNSTNVGNTTLIEGWADGMSTIVKNTTDHILTFNVNGVEFKMVYVEGTDDNITLSVGNQTTTPSSDASATYVNQIVKGLSDYYIGQTEVTNDLWVAVMGGTAPSEKSTANKFPVTNVTYTQLMGTGDGTAEDCFIKKLNDLAAGQLPTGMKFTLPSQVQWQYAAQGGKYTNGYTYAGSSTWGDSFWNGDNSGSTPHQVATKPANELGLYDMSGNVWEWCGDWYYVATNNAELAKDYWCDTAGSYRVLRGGYWNDFQSTREAFFQPRFRVAVAPSHQGASVGFRLALQ